MSRYKGDKSWKMWNVRFVLTLNETNINNILSLNWWLERPSFLFWARHYGGFVGFTEGVPFPSCSAQIFVEMVLCLLTSFLPEMIVRQSVRWVLVSRIFRSITSFWERGKQFQIDVRMFFYNLALPPPSYRLGGMVVLPKTETFSIHWNIETIG